MAESAMPQVGDVVADKYEIAELIGEGGMGAVFLATHKLTGKRVALKWMLPELARNEDAVKRFLREAQAAGRIAHPNVVDIYDVGEHKGSYFLVMEYLHGESLIDAMERGPLTPEQAVEYILPCLRGVSAAHRKGVIHRDLKPDNIFLCRNDDGTQVQPKVLDFGISKISGHDGDLNPRLTKTGAVMGTPYYMSPEQIRGSHDVDGRCDVYAFGVILYEALTGQVPFNADTYSALVLEIATGTARSPQQVNPNLPAGLADVIMKAMAREPGDRYADVMALAVALETCVEGANPAHTDSRWTQPRRSTMSETSPTPFSTVNARVEVPGRRRSRGVVLGITLLVLALVGAYVAMAPKEEKRAAAGSLPAPVEENSAIEGPTEPAVEETTAKVGGEVLPEVDVPGAEDHDDGVLEGVAVDTGAEAVKAEDAKAKQAARRRAQRARAKAGRNTQSAAERSAPAVKPVPAKPPAPLQGRTGRLTVDDF